MVSMTFDLLTVIISIQSPVFASYNFIHRVNWEEAERRASTNESDSSLNVSPAHKSGAGSETRQEYLILYASIIVFGIFCYLSRSYFFYKICIRISINLHDWLFRGISRSKMIFLNNNPSGRILNRFSRDIDCVDSSIPSIMFEVFFVIHGNFHAVRKEIQSYISVSFQNILFCLGILTINVIISPWMLIPSSIMIALFYLMRIAYLRVGRSLQRIESLSKLAFD